MPLRRHFLTSASATVAVIGRFIHSVDSGAGWKRPIPTSFDASQRIGAAVHPVASVTFIADDSARRVPGYAGAVV